MATDNDGDDDGDDKDEDDDVDDDNNNDNNDDNVNEEIAHRRRKYKKPIFGRDVQGSNKRGRPNHQV